MKKKFLLLYALIILTIIGACASMSDNIRLSMQFDEENVISLTICSHNREEIIYPYEDPESGTLYFFLPAYAQNKAVRIDHILGQTVFVNEQETTAGYRLRYETDTPCEIAILNETDPSASGSVSPQTYQIMFMCSANIPAVYVETESDSMDFLNANKDNAEPGAIRVVLEDGSYEYAGALERISGRGNSTWGYDKKPYAIKLEESQALLGMDQGKKWYLLPIFREANRMNTRIVMDIAARLGLPYTSGCTWIDLYLNGEYNGNYLLCEAISVESGRVEIHDLEKENRAQNPDIEQAAPFGTDNCWGYELANGNDVDGGYLIEKDMSGRAREEKSGFQTESGAFFTLKSPEYASWEQVEYIQNYFQRIEDMIADGNPDYENYIDLDSFVARFLIDEISLNYDASISNMFFYKDQNDSLLHTGPVWDYDWSMGWGKEDVIQYIDYEHFSLFDERDQSLSWYRMLYENETFYNRMRDTFRNLLPYMNTLIDSTIDQYADTVRASAMMDETRWKHTYTGNRNRGNYEDFDNNVRYLKYFLANRLNFLCGKWDISYPAFTSVSNGSLHQVTFLYHDEIIETLTVRDGETITAFPALPDSEYAWYFDFNYKRYCDKLPIYEDCTLFAQAPPSDE